MHKRTCRGYCLVYRIINLEVMVEKQAAGAQETEFCWKHVHSRFGIGGAALLCDAVATTELSCRVMYVIIDGVSSGFIISSV